MKNLEKKLKTIAEDIKVVSQSTFSLKNEYITTIKIKLGNKLETIIKTAETRSKSVTKAMVASKSLASRYKGVRYDRVKNSA